MPLALLVSLSLNAQQVDKIVFFGAGASSSVTNTTKSVSGVAGAKLVFHLGAGGWFSQLSGSASLVAPQVMGAKTYWSTRPTVSLGYRFRNGKSRFSLFGGFGETRNKIGDFLPTAVAGGIVKLKRRWGVLTDVSHSSQSWATSTTLGYRF